MARRFQTTVRRRVTSAYSVHGSELSPNLKHVKLYTNECFPCRSNEIDQLLNLFKSKEEPYPCSVYVYGGPSTGKSSIIKHVLKNLKINYVMINIIECYTSKNLYEIILNKFSGLHVYPLNGQPYTKCENLMEFTYQLKKISSIINLNGSVLVIDKVDELRDMDLNLLNALLKLKELTGISLCVVFVSEILFEKYVSRSNVCEPIKIYFPQYTKEQLLEIMKKDYNQAQHLIVNNFQKPIHFDLTFYHNYLNVFLSVFFRACKDLAELKHMSKVNFIKYCDPINQNENTINDSVTLWRNMAPLLKSSLETLYLRVLIKNSAKSVEIQSKEFLFSKEKLAQSLELPYYAKFLLIAAYLASYNPVKDDKRLFMKFHEKSKKSIKDVKLKSKVSEHYNTQLGPKMFSFDRLLAIFYAILDKKVGFNNNLLVQVSSLVELQFLITISDNCSLDGQKYKCNINFEFVNTISKMLGFNIRKYLSDFSHM
ncbi:unnamed protein product [Brassicogethes aeneus]|uniref:Origin recognition complex subunit 5 n=1 Tax=Brassicogethes aeneus TaxID=1431903 RepID=A0A9P0B165_BRAAE|nr:unnamed protein product [Brassicogethes aeneus]